MTKFMRALVTAAVAGLSLLFAGSALSAISTPKLQIGVGGTAAKASIGINARVSETDDWVGRLQIYVPAGFKLNPSATTAKGQVTAVATLYGGDQIQTMGAGLKPIAANDPSLSWATTNCDNTAHVGAWMVTAQSGADTWSFPIFVDATTGTETQYGANKLVACFGPRSPGGSNQYSNKFMGLSLTLSGFSAPTAAGDYTWRSLWTPFAGDQSVTSGNQGGDTLNQAGSVEAQSTTRLASGQLTLAARHVGTHVVLSGKLVVGGEATSGVTVALAHGQNAHKLVSMGSTKTRSAGTFSIRTLFVKKATFFQAGATIAAQDLGSGGCKASFGLPCLDATTGGASYSSIVVHLKK
jgi:hypothetical protein